MNYWQALAGLGLFLFALGLVEKSLQDLTGRAFKQLLQSQTTNRFKSILVGTVSTIVLQSSSAITLLVLAFVGSGILSFHNSIGIILGTNLGTTFTGWIVATLGFEVNIENYIFPIVGVGAAILAFLKKPKFINDMGLFVFAIGVLFLGLNYMKISFGDAQNWINPEVLKGQGYLVFAIVGFIVTTIIQASSATMVIALTALSTGVLDLPSSAALVIGADLGTTSTVIIGALGGTSNRKKVAGAHFFFNLVVDVLALAFLPGLLILVQGIVGQGSPLFSLVALHTTMNLFGILLFLPFLGRFAGFLDWLFKENGRPYQLQVAPGGNPDLTFVAIQKASVDFFGMAVRLFNSAFEIKRLSFNINQFVDSLSEKDFEQKYLELKNFESEILRVVVDFQSQSLSKEYTEQSASIASSVRDLAMAVKNLKDVRHNFLDLNESTMEHEFHYSQIFDEQVKSMAKLAMSYFEEIQSTKNPKELEPKLDSFSEMIRSLYQETNAKIYKTIAVQKAGEVLVSNILNCNHEVNGAGRHLISALHGYLAQKYATKSQPNGDKLSERPS